MDNIHSYEQRSVSELVTDHAVFRSRLILANRLEPHCPWSTQNRTTSTGSRWVPCSRASGYLTMGLRWMVSRASCCTHLSSNSRGDPQSLNQTSRSGPNPASYHSGPFPPNEWRTSKYTVLSFLPKNLFEQFQRLANFYFLLTALLQIVLPFSPVGPTTSLLPLLFVVSTSAVKQAYEDYLRHRLDREVNNRQCHVLRGKRLVKIRSKDIRVGDFVFVKNNEEIPCDMVLIASGGRADRCNITTANLDGESSLKSRSCALIRQLLGSIGNLDESLLILECEMPNATLYEFNGYLRVPKTREAYDRLVAGVMSQQNRDRPTLGSVSGNPVAGGCIGSQEDSNNQLAAAILHRVKNPQSRILSSALMNAIKQRSSSQLSASDTWVSDFHEIPLDISNLLLRASRLRNTRYIYGLAVYTGQDTKLAHNSQVKANKFSSIERRINLFLVIAFLILILFSLIGALNYSSPNYWFLEKLDKTDSFGQIFAAHFLIYNYILPISLYVTLEFVKFFGTISVIEDKKMRLTVWHSVSKDTIQEDSSEKTCSKTNIETSTAKNTMMVDTKSLGSQNLACVSSIKRVKKIEGPKCNSSDLNEELGQVNVLFSDKTGTLTENKMRFMACTIQGHLHRSVGDFLFLQPPEMYPGPIRRVVHRLARVPHGRHLLISGAGKSSRRQTTTKLASPRDSALGSRSRDRDADKSRDSPRPSSHKPFDHRVLPPIERLRRVDKWNENDHVVEFFMCLCLCSSLTLNEKRDLAECLPDKTNMDYDFQTASPDEESLILAAHMFGISICKSDDHECYIAIERSRLKDQASKSNKLAGKFQPIVEGSLSTETYIVRRFKRLQVLEFNSIRKRMSVIYRDCDTERILMVSKGSEELLDCVDFSNLSHQAESAINSSLAHFEAFSLSGLRTMLVARRDLSEEDYKHIETGIREARVALSNRDNLMSKVYAMAETDLVLLGATAVEDTLQEGVPETIVNLKRAGIKVWLLTGDKVETAISVAFLCKLLEPDMHLFNLIRQQNAESCQKLLCRFKRKLEAAREGQSIGSRVLVTTKSGQAKSLSLNSVSTQDSSSNSPGGSASTYSQEPEHELKFALIADGRSLYYAMKYARDELKVLCQQCACVLGCRLSPLQKAEVVSMIKASDAKLITAAIGDGANDVSMIQEAHVGIGISGKEGRQAVNSSDFAISRFYMLNRLIFVHGHLFYHRTVNTIHYFFYKNILFITPQFLYSFYNLSSAMSLYHPMHLIGYNLFFTSIPVLIYGLYEINIPENLLERNPRLYRLNQGNRQMRLCTFFQWIVLGVCQALIGFYLLLYNFGSHTPILESGKMMGINGFSMVLYFVIVLAATFKIYLLSKNHSTLIKSSAILSCLLMPLMFFSYSLIDWGFLIQDNSLYGSLQGFLLSPMFWVAIATTTTATLLPDIFWYLKQRATTIEQLGCLLGSQKALSIS